MTDKNSISVALVREALLAPRRHGANPSDLLRQADVTPALLDSLDARVSIRQFAQLWRAIAAELDDEFFGMNTRPLRTGSFAFLCRASLAYTRLEDALRHHLAFVSLMLDGVSATLERHHDLAEIRLRETGAPQRAFAYFTYWTILHGITCWLAERRIPLLAVELRCSPPDYWQDYQVMFGQNLRFSCAVSRIVFAASHLDLPIQRTQADLRRFLAQAPANIIVRYNDSESLASRIKDILRRRPAATWPGAETLARELHISPSTLRRRLRHAGRSYQALKDSVRRESAMALLAEPSLQIEQVAGQLGFADASSFYRAFHRWTGSNPGRYRQLMVGAEPTRVESTHADPNDRVSA